MPSGNPANIRIDSRKTSESRKGGTMPSPRPAGVSHTRKIARGSRERASPQSPVPCKIPSALHRFRHLQARMRLPLCVACATKLACGEAACANRFSKVPTTPTASDPRPRRVHAPCLLNCLFMSSRHGRASSRCSRRRSRMSSRKSSTRLPASSIRLCSPEFPRLACPLQPWQPSFLPKQTGGVGYTPALHPPPVTSATDATSPPFTPGGCEQSARTNPFLQPPRGRATALSLIQAKTAKRAEEVHGRRIGRQHPMRPGRKPHAKGRQPSAPECERSSHLQRLPRFERHLPWQEHRFS